MTSAAATPQPEAGDLARYIDHTQLRPEATREDVARLCDEARRYGFAGVCVSSGLVGLAARLLAGSEVRPVAVVGFPLGSMAHAAKAFEAAEAVRAGAAEIDMVLDLGALKGRDFAAVYEDIHAVVESARPAPVKVILETALLDTEEKIAACALASAAGAAFVKTCTGFGGGAATVEDVALMRRVVGPALGVKASGGIRSAADARRLLAAGATRLGASASLAIIGASAAPGAGY